MLIVLLWLLYGAWAVALKRSGEGLSPGWVCLIGITLSLPFDVWSVWSVRNEPRPALAPVLWVVAIFLTSALATLVYVRAARFYDAIALTALVALYPIAATAMFWLLGERVTGRQVAGLMFAAISAILMS